MDAYWRSYDACLDQIRDEGDTVADVIRICYEHFGQSAGLAFFPGGGDRDLLGTLAERGWNIYWAAADYHFKARDHNGRALEYVEGDIYADPKPHRALPAHHGSSGDAVTHVEVVTDAAADHHTPTRDLDA